MREWLLTFYGDDFTGSTDSLEALTTRGLPAVLFLQPPTDAQLAEFPDCRAFGIAGVSRSMSPAQMDAELEPAFMRLREVGARFVHYKVCSTFDSSPTVGSIGHAIEIGQRIFASSFVPLVVGAPGLRRYVLFGNLFAGVGGETYRLDRHPTMPRHPITPMTESDLRRHLARQTAKGIGLVDLLALAQAPADALAAVRASGAEIVLFDTLDELHLAQIGQLLWEQGDAISQFIVGSSGVEYALAAHLEVIGIAAPPATLQGPGRADQILVMTGSAAPTTASQIAYAEAQGYVCIRLDAARLIDPAQAAEEAGDARTAALAALVQGANVLLYATRGPDDPSLRASRAHAQAIGIADDAVGQRLAQQQGALLAELVAQSGVRRLCVAGGDTAGYAARALGIYALEMIAPIAPGAPLCRARSTQPRFDGLEISLKGGQNGQADYFELIRLGGKQ
jgi:uncharacterized protein YgbK (DUF1537 family)